MDYLGYVCFYSLPSDVIVPLSELQQFKDKFDPLIKLPKAPSTTNLFKRVCKQTGWKDSNGEKFYFIEAKETKREVKRIFVWEYKHRGKKKLEELGSVTLKKKNSTLVVENPNSDFSMQDAYNDIKSGMDHKDTVDHMAVRSIIKEALEDKLEALWLNPGTYFVEEQYFQRLVTLQQILADILGNINLQIIPLIDDAYQRDMLATAYNTAIKDMYTDQYEPAKVALGPKPTMVKINKVKKIIEQTAKLVKKHNQYVVDEVDIQHMDEIMQKNLDTALENTND